MSQWHKTTLGDCADWLSGGTPSKAHPEYWLGDIPWVSAKDMKHFRLNDAMDHLSQLGAENGTRLAPRGSILMLVRGMTLHQDVPLCIINRPMAFNQDVKAICPKQGVDTNYLAYWLLANKPTLLSLVDSASHGTGRIHTDILKAAELQIPPLSEQTAIAHILSTLDDKIELNRRMNQTLEAMAQALFKSWFLGHALKSVPKGWRTENLDSIARFLNGLALQKFPADRDNSLPVIKIAQLRAGNTLGADRASAAIPRDYVVQNGDVLFSWSGSLEVELWCGGSGALNQHLFKVTSQHFPKWFYYLWTRHHLPGFQAIAADKATTMGHIQRRHLTEAKVLVPPQNELEQMDAAMRPLIDRFIANNIESRTLAHLRDTLLPKLLSGELRIPDAEKFLEAGT